MIEIDKLILDATKERRILEKDVYRLIKAKFIEYKTSKNAKPLTESIALDILRRMIKERKEASCIYNNAGCEELADRELAEIKVIEALLPKSPSREEIEKYLKSYLYVAYPGGATKKEMKFLMNNLKKEFPNAEGKMLSEIVLANIKD